MFAIPRSPFQWYEEHQWFRIITKFKVWSVSAFIYMCNPYGKHDEPILHYAYTALLKAQASIGRDASLHLLDKREFARAKKNLVRKTSAK